MCICPVSFALQIPCILYRLMTTSAGSLASELLVKLDSEERWQEIGVEKREVGVFIPQVLTLNPPPLPFSPR